MFHESGVKIMLLYRKVVESMKGHEWDVMRGVVDRIQARDGVVIRVVFPKYYPKQLVGAFGKKYGVATSNALDDRNFIVRYRIDE